MMKSHDGIFRIAINGFGRIGRSILRAYLSQAPQKYAIVHINDPAPLETLVHLLKYDSVHGTLNAHITHHDHTITCTLPQGESHRISVSSERSPAQLPWRSLGIDVVMECSGRFTDGADHGPDSLQGHLSAGAHHVLVSSPAKNVDAMVVYGVNHQSLTHDHRIISNASCTTNCLAPIAQVLHHIFRIQTGYMTTVHAYTADQCLVDGPHKDLYRARAAALSMIPTTTGAARAVGQVLPDLQGKLDGTAIRVPTANVSMIDLSFTSEKPMTVASINDAMRTASLGELKGIVAYNTEPLVSIDFRGHMHSAIFDATQTQVMGDHFGRILAWYDNEWGFSHRMLDVAAHMQSVLH